MGLFGVFSTTVILTSDAKGHHFCHGCKNQNCLIRFRGNTRCSLELFLRNTESACHLIMCKYLMTRKDILHLLILCSSTSTFFKMSLLISWNIQSLGKTDVDNRIIEATIKKPFLARGTLNLKNGLNEKK